MTVESLGANGTDHDHVLYRFYSATGQLLYVGITMSPPKRFAQHSKDKSWWGEVSGITVETFISREELELAERRAIQVERPKYNVVHNGVRKLHRIPGMAQKSMGNELDHVCEGCGQPVRDGTGYVHVDKSAVYKRRDRVREIENRAERREASACASFEDSGSLKTRVFTGSDLMSYPSAIRWRTHHAECDSDVDSNDYWISIDRIRTHTHLLRWTAHLMGKGWVRDTNWSEFIQHHLPESERWL